MKRRGLPPANQCVTIGEGQTLLHESNAVGRYVGMKPGRLLLQYEGMNPSGSFKDNGMAAAFTHGRMIGATRAACASTGNTSASLSLYCSVTGLMKSVIFVGSGKIAKGKLSQALDYGALTLQIAGDFDDAMRLVERVCESRRIYLLNSINPFRIEGQKAIGFELLHDLRNRRTLLADSDVDAVELLALVVAGGVVVDLLVQDRVERHGGLAGLTVADDQLALTAADGGHAVHGLEATELHGEITYVQQRCPTLGARLAM